jgi:hypothetical protein
VTFGTSRAAICFPPPNRGLTADYYGGRINLLGGEGSAIKASQGDGNIGEFGLRRFSSGLLKNESRLLHIYEIRFLLFRYPVKLEFHMNLMYNINYGGYHFDIKVIIFFI